LEKNKRIVIITTGQPSVNPRIVKEADAFALHGHEVIVLYCFWIDWAQKADERIFKKSKWNHKQIGGTPFNNSRIYWFTRIQFKLVRTLNSLLGNILCIAELSQARSYKQLLQAAKMIKADWYIGHNLGALAIAVKAAKFNLAKAGFDFEDYHREENQPMSKVDRGRIEFLEKKYLPQINYISTASPLITQKVKSNFRELTIPIITINNAFSLSDQQNFITKQENDNSIQLFWFSQTVGSGRGLETVLQALNILNDKTFHLTLVGKHSNEIETIFKTMAGSMSENIHFEGVVEGDKIMAIAASMDIGLAIEQNTPYNRDICLTNKIFTYLLAGNAIILTNTQAQTNFQNEYDVGLMYSVNDVEQCCFVLNKYKSDKNLLSLQREKNWQLANKILNWEKESEKLLNMVSR
jgi:hypothetical protein